MTLLHLSGERKKEEEGDGEGGRQRRRFCRVWAGDKEGNFFASLNDSTAYISSVTSLDVIFMTLMWNFFQTKEDEGEGA